jgi:hypothetical protein
MQVFHPESGTAQCRPVLLGKEKVEETVADLIKKGEIQRDRRAGPS